jgi:retinol dehydrogenase-12
VAAHPRLAGVSGRYFADCNEALPSPAATNRHEAERLWQISESMLLCTNKHSKDASAP